MSLIPCKKFTFMGGTVFEIAGGGGIGSTPPPLVKGVGTKRLGKERVNFKWFVSQQRSRRVVGFHLDDI